MAISFRIFIQSITLCIAKILKGAFKTLNIGWLYLCVRVNSQQGSFRFRPSSILPGVDVTRFNRHLLRSKLNWSDSHEESEIPGRIQG